MASPTRTEYKVNMRDPRGRRSFTLVNATSEDAAREVAERHHRAKVIVSVEPTGRTF